MNFPRLMYLPRFLVPYLNRRANPKAMSLEKEKCAFPGIFLFAPSPNLRSVKACEVICGKETDHVNLSTDQISSG